MSAPDIFETACRLGFESEPRTACNPLISPARPNCEGTGFVWRDGETTLSSSGLRRLARMKSDST
jgi:hypothetical protein